MTKPTLDPAAFDLDAYEDVTQAEVTIKDPVTGAPTALVITIAGPEHPARRKIMFERQRRARRELQRTGKLPVSDPAEDEETENEVMAACTLAWRGLVRAGKPVECTPAAALALYQDPKRRWLRDQVKTAMDEREAFIRRSAAT